MKLLDVLCVIFVVLKLVGVISWSWWWVFSPILIPLAIFFVLLIIKLILETLEKMIDK